MHPLVLLEVGTLVEPFPTIWAAEGSLTHMDPLVTDKMGALSKMLSTLWAAKGPLASVCTEMAD